MQPGIFPFPISAVTSKKFTKSGDFIVPKTGWYLVTLIGGGGGGGGSGSINGGGGGASASAIKKLLFLRVGQVIPIGIGAGGVFGIGGSPGGTNGTKGGNSTFGNYLTAKGADGGVAGNTSTGGATDTTATMAVNNEAVAFGTGFRPQVQTSIEFVGNPGAAGAGADGGVGAASIYGLGGSNATPGTPNPDATFNNLAYGGYGAGGGGGRIGFASTNGAGAGGYGAPGYCEIESDCFMA